MTDREKVVKGLECCLANAHNNCPYKSTDEGIDKVTSCTTYLMKDALALLKAQEPRVMTLEEVKQFVFGAPYIIETNEPDNESRMMYGLYSHQGLESNFDFAVTDMRKRLFDINYGKTWRCWTSRPTYEQRKAVKWDDA